MLHKVHIQINKPLKQVVVLCYWSQWSVDKMVSYLLAGQSFFLLACFNSREATHTNFIVFGLTRLGSIPWIQSFVQDAFEVLV
jgi:hypothetical protein